MPRNPPSQSKQAFALLDHFSVEDMQKWGILRKKILRFYWDYYHDLAFQRSQVSREINFSLLNAAVGPFEFSEWQRMVKLKYSVDPLSIEGSLIDPGGRFNIGDINPTLFPPFPALYIASDKETALQEALCQTIRNDHDKQQALDLALANSTSITNISLSGYIDSYIDLTRPKTIAEFSKSHQGFYYSESVNLGSKRDRSSSPCNNQKHD